MSAIVQQTGISSLGTGMSVLGELQPKIPVGGKIRPGIKVLTKAHAANAKAKEIYDAGIAARKPFGIIEREIMAACNLDKTPLVPKNVPYFTVHPKDFLMPEVAHAILDTYATDGPQGRQLYKFPVIFAVDGWQANMPHALQVYTRSERVYWSEYGPDGKRYCKTHAPVPIDDKSKRATRVYGGRPVVLRAEREGLCDPQKCPEYQNRQCNLSGQFVFYIPGIPGTAAISLPTNSFYSMQQARQKLEMVQFITGGKISGTFNGKAIFYITKKLEEISMIEDGKPKKVKQWLIGLEADIDMTAVFQRGEARAALEHGTQAAALLEGPRDDDVDETDEADDEGDTNDEDLDKRPDPKAERTTEIEAIKAARENVKTGLDALKIDIMHFSAYAVAKWGADWSRTLDGLKKADELLRTADKDPAVLKQINEWKSEGEGE